MTWKRQVLKLVTQFCDERGSRSFAPGEFCAFAEPVLAQMFPKNFHREAKIRQTLQFLRDDQLIGFKGQGNYTLLGQTLLRAEVEPEALPILQAFQGQPEKREYLIEIYARNKGLVKTARQLFNSQCACSGCTNSF